MPGALEVLGHDEAVAGAEGVGDPVLAGDGDRAAQDRADLVDAVPFKRELTELAEF